MKTFIVRSGNKSKYIKKYLAPHIPKHYSTYIEPFVGSGALFLYLQPKKWIINDINKDIINIWNTVYKTPNKIVKYFKQFSERYLIQKSEDEILLNCKHQTNIVLPRLSYDSKRASLFLIMTFLGYLGNIIRNNSFYFPGLNKNQNYDKLHFLSEKFNKNLMNIHDYLKSNSDGMIKNIDYKQILKKAKSEDFVYLDPPYLEKHDYKFNYNQNENIDETFVNKLYSELKRLDNKNVKFLMTQANTSFVRNTFKEFKIISFDVFRGFTNTPSKELIIKNY